MSVSQPLDGATQVAEGSPPGPTAGYLDRLTATLRSRAAVSAVYGEPVEAAGVTVIPVAVVRFVFGGGMGRGEDAAEGGGGGAIASAVPAGYIEIKEGSATFHPVHRSLTDQLRPAAVILAGDAARAARAWAKRRRN